MPTLQHPEFLNAFQRFRQAKTILHSSSRATNPSWYYRAYDIDFQIHIRADGASLTSSFFDRQKSQWSTGPALPLDIHFDSTKLEALAAEVVRHARSIGAKAIGVVLHVADEFATTELKADFDNPDTLAEIREAAIHDPSSILEDGSISTEQFSWRALPYPAPDSDSIGTAIAISKQFDNLLSVFREYGEKNNFPVITHAFSAPLIALMGLDRILAPTPGRPFVSILQYPWFTVLAFFTETSDLRLVRTFQHRGMRRPTNFRNSLATTNASLEFVDPDLFIIPLGQNVDTTLDADLRITFTSSRVEVIPFLDNDGIPSWGPEPLIATAPSSDNPPSLSSHTFTLFREEKWPLQDFLPMPKERGEIYPQRSDMRLLSSLKYVHILLLLLVVGALGFVAKEAFAVVSQPEWAFDASQADIAKRRLSTMSAERNHTEHWSNLLEDRSRAWVTMEFFSRLFPESGGMLVKTFAHSAKPDNSVGKTAAGFIKDWKITGLARDEAQGYLTNLSTREGISAHFNEIAKVTGNSSYAPGPDTRSIVINIRTQENSGYKPLPLDEFSLTDESTYPFTFDLTISQRFESNDSLAISASKAPATK